MATQLRAKMEEFQSIFQDTYDGLSPETNYATMAGRSADDKAIRNLLDMEGANLDLSAVQRRCELQPDKFRVYLKFGEDKDQQQTQGNYSHSTQNLATQASGSNPISTNSWLPWQSKRSARSVFGLPLISPLNEVYSAWNTIIILLDSTYTAFLVPILVGFNVSDVTWTWGCIIDLVCGTFYFVEFWLGFHVGFVGACEGQRKLIMDGKAIARYYVVKGRCPIDLLTAVAWVVQIVLLCLVVHAGIQLDSSVTAAYQIVRVLRLLRFFSLLRRLYATAIATSAFVLPGLSVSRAGVNFFNLIYGGAVLINFLACLWNFTAQAEGFDSTWINFYSPFTRQYGDGGNLLDSNGALVPDAARAIPGPHRWLISVYYVLVTVGTVGYGDIYPQTIVETIIGLGIIGVGLVFFGLLLGSIASSLQQLSKDARRAAMFRSRMEAVDKWMSDRGLDKKIRYSVSKFYAEVQPPTVEEGTLTCVVAGYKYGLLSLSTKYGSEEDCTLQDWLRNTEAVEEVQIMGEIPQQLRKSIALQVNLPLFNQLQIFHDFPAALQSNIAGMMSPMQVPAGFELCDVEDAADCFWILHEGELAVQSITGQVTTLRSPALAGQISILQEQDEQYLSRPCSYKAHSSCLLWSVNVRELLVLLKAHPQWYAKASQQAVPGFSFDYLNIDPPREHLLPKASNEIASVRNGDAGISTTRQQRNDAEGDTKPPGGSPYGNITGMTTNSDAPNIPQAPGLAARRQQQVRQAAKTNSTAKRLHTLKGIKQGKG